LSLRVQLNSGEEVRRRLKGEVTHRIVQCMPRFMSGYPSRRYARCKVYSLTQPQCLGTRIVMIAQHPRTGLDCYVAKALRIEQPACHLGASDSVLGADLRILRNIDFDARLRIRAQQQTRKNKYPKNRVS